MNTATESTADLAHHPVVSEAQWLAASRDLLKREKELTRQRDELARQRRALPWVKVTKNYTFDTPEGKKSLAELFAGRSQLIVQHFMFAPDWDEGCSGCSFMADGVDGALQHLVHHDVMYVAISRAPLPKLLAYRQRMGWRFPWSLPATALSTTTSTPAFHRKIWPTARSPTTTTTSTRPTRPTCPAAASSTRTRKGRYSTPTRCTAAAQKP